MCHACVCRIETSMRVMGEEYPNFLDDPTTVAGIQGRGQRTLAQAGGDRAICADRFMPAITPGLRIRNGLGGNVGGKTESEVNAWRSAYMTARAKAGAHGLAEFNWMTPNYTALDATLRDMAKVLGTM